MKLVQVYEYPKLLKKKKKSSDSHWEHGLNVAHLSWTWLGSHAPIMSHWQMCGTDSSYLSSST